MKAIGLIFFLGISYTIFAQNTFPNSWKGNYTGELQIFGVDSVKMNVPMKLDILKKTDSIYEWKITYEFKGKIDERAYELVVKNPKLGYYVIDEKNSIQIDSYYKMEVLTSFFEVMNSYIVSTYTKVNDSIIFEIISGNGNKPMVSGNTKQNEEVIPEVKSYLVNGRQKAILKKI